MHLASYNIRGRTSFGVVVGDGIVDLRPRLAPRFSSVLDILRGGALEEAKAVAAGVRADFALNEAEVLPPVLGGEKILCIGVNYANRNEELAGAGGTENAKYPSMFFRTPNSLVGHEHSIVRPPESVQLDYEGEIAIVIGREGRRIPMERALDHVAGITLCNEGTIRDWLRHGRFNVTQGKNFDATGSVGPWMTTGLDLAKPLHLTVRINGEVTQDDTTASMIFSFSDLIVYVSTFMTLKPGDVIATGTPIKLGAKSETPRWLKAGDVIEIAVPEIGTLRNKVVDE
jgi:2-keto-4-pentenoate hydratase/2-oxohepta-3-ene-1,7-dioic acid hydratase in catechol pathway